MLTDALSEAVEMAVTTTEALGEISLLTPVVVALRAGTFLQGFMNPFAADPFEHGLMVAEKVAVAAESVAAATAAAGLGFLAGHHPLRAAADITRAAAQPVRRRLRANVARLSGTEDA